MDNTITVKEFQDTLGAPKKKSSKKEEKIQVQLCRYAKAKYPDLIFSSDIASGMSLTIGQAVKAKSMRSSRGMPDVVFMEAKRGHYALCIELKREGTKIYLKNGVTLVADEHIREQNDMLNRLMSKNYFASFAIGINEAINILDWYMNDKLI